jgi:malonate transporter
LTGYLARRFEVLGEESAAALTRFVYYFAFPAAIFVFSARAPIAKTFNWPFIGAFVAGSGLTLLLALSVGRLWFRHDVATLSIVGFRRIRQCHCHGSTAPPDGLWPGWSPAADRGRPGF